MDLHEDGRPAAAENGRPHDATVARRLTVLPAYDLGERSVLAAGPGQGRTPLFEGGGRHDLVCGTCDHVIARAVPDDRLRELVLKCPACGALNETVT